MPKKLKIVVAPKYEQLKPLIAAIPDSIAEQGEIIYKDRNTVYRTLLGENDVTVKSFHVPAFLNRIAYTFIRKGKARRSFENAVELGKLGIGTPEPVAYIEEYEGGLLARSYYICRMFAGSNIRHWETIDHFEDMIRAFAGFILDLHQKGVLHKDFTPGNILFDTDGNGRYRFVLVDINRMKFGVSDRRLLYRNFGALNIESEEETARVAKEYARLAGLDPEEMGNMAVKLLRGYHAKKRRLRILKRCFGRKQKK